jgi:hypothetical protein
MVRAEERFAFQVLRRVLGARVEVYDDNSRPGMVDGLFWLPDGAPGAIEVTTLGSEDALEVEGLLTGREWRVAGARWAWHGWIPPGASVRQFETHLPVVVIACERENVIAPDALGVVHGEERNAKDWFISNSVRLHGFPETSNPGAIWVIPDGGGGGAVDYQLAALPPWLSAQFEQPLLAEHVEKLSATQLPEQHLFLRLHDSALPEALMVSLSFYESIPVVPPVVPANLTSVWLAPRWKMPILRWQSRAGWTREDYD